MSKPLADRIPFAKLVTIFAASFGVGLGLCGLGFFLNTHGAGRGDEEFGGVQPIVILSLIIIVVSFLGLVVTLLTWALVGMLGGASEPQKLFGDAAEKKSDEGHDA